MKNIKQIREEHDVLTSNKDFEGDKLTMLARAGLLEEKRIPIVKRAIDKNGQMTPAEKKALNEFLESLMIELVDSPVLNEAVKKKTEIAKNDYLNKFDPRFNRNASERDLPYIIVLRRKAIRIYPDNQKVGLYYSQALDRYVSIPWDKAGTSVMSEEVGKPTTVVSGSTSVPSTRKAGPWGKRPSKSQLDADRKDDEETARIKKVVKNSKAKARDKLVATKSAGALNRHSPNLYKYALNKTLNSNASAVERYGAAAGMMVNKLATQAYDKVKGAIVKNKNIRESFQNKLEARRVERLDEVTPLAIGLGMAGQVARHALGGAAIGKGIEVGSKVAGKVAGKARTMLSRRKPPSNAQKAKPKPKAAKKDKSSSSYNIDMSSDSDNSGTSSNATDKSSYSSPLKPIEGGGKVMTRSSFSNETSADAARRERERQAMFRENVMTTIKKLASKEVNENVLINLSDGQMSINNNIANKIVSLYESVNETNKKKIDEMLNENVQSFKKIVEFAVRQ